jgi:hypothetical protein
MKLIHKFITLIPTPIEEGILYISLEYATAMHKCVCGCKNDVVTPLSPDQWKLTFDGETVSLYPSIGNWSFPCRSHYWITNNTIRHARKWSEDEIEKKRKDDSKSSQRYFKRKNN